MALHQKRFHKKPPDGLLNVADNMFVFDCCFSTDVLEEIKYKVYIGGIARHLHDHFRDASFMVFNFGEGQKESRIASILSEYDMTVIDYPRHYEGCPLLTMEMIHHLLKSSDSWLSLGKNNFLLMHCEQGGWPTLSFVLAALLIYLKHYTGEQKTLEMIYKLAPSELVELFSPLNPMPSQLTYLQYISRRDIMREWPPKDRELTLDCAILRMIPNFEGKGGCRPMFRIYGRDPVMPYDPTSKVLFSSPKESKSVRYYREADSELVKVDIRCQIQGDVVLECSILDEDLEREKMVFRVMFNTAFIRSSVLMLNSDEVDVSWAAKDRFTKDFRAEVHFSEINAAPSSLTTEIACAQEREGLPKDASGNVQETFSYVDRLGTKGDPPHHLLQQIASSNTFQEKPDPSSQKCEVGHISHEFRPNILIEKLQIEKSSEKVLTRNSEVITNSPFQPSNSKPKTSASPRFDTLTHVPPTDQEPSTDMYSNSSSNIPSSPLPANQLVSGPSSLPTKETASMSPPPRSHFVSSQIATMPSTSSNIPSPPVNNDISTTSITSLPSTQSNIPPSPPPPATFSVPSSSPPATMSTSTPLVDKAAGTKGSRPPPPSPSHVGSSSVASKLPSPAPPPPPPSKLSSPAPPPPPPFTSKPSSGSSLQKPSPILPVPMPPISLSGLKGRSRSPRKWPSLKQLHWNKVRPTPYSIWEAAQKDEASKTPEINMLELERHFSAATALSKKTIKPKSEKVHLIDYNRARNCGVTLKKIKIPLPDLMSSVLTLDDSVLDAYLVDYLIKLCPTEAEKTLLRCYKGDKDKLGQCEQFFLEVMQVPGWESKLKVLSFKINFRSKAEDLRDKLNIVKSASEEVRNSVKFRRIMLTILSLGNALNRGTSKDRAAGFKLDCLLKLRDVRGGDSKMTLMHYLCKVLADKLPEALDFHKDLANLQPASKIQLKYLAEEMEAITKGFKNVEKESSDEKELTPSDQEITVSQTVQKDDGYIKALEEFLPFAESEVRSLKSLYSMVGQSADALILYFDEDPKRYPFDQVVETLLNFVKMFESAHIENVKQQELEKKKLARNQHKEALSTQIKEIKLVRTSK